VVEKSGSRLAYVASGRIVSSERDALAARLATILDGLAEVIGTFVPAEVAVEQVFVNVNPRSTLLLGQARGAAICAAVTAKLPISEYTALQVKQAVVGQGHARKEQVQEMVRRLLKLPGVPGPDAADALACAICHAHGGLGAMPARGRRVRSGRIVLEASAAREGRR
jgi:crossover junction endodeoxyribonuclease RuvC